MAECVRSPAVEVDVFLVIKQRLRQASLIEVANNDKEYVRVCQFVLADPGTQFPKRWFNICQKWDVDCSQDDGSKLSHM